MGAMGLQSGQPCQARRASEGQHDMVSAMPLTSMDMSGRQHCRLSEDIASTSGPPGEAAAPKSLSEVSFYRDESATVSVADQATIDRASDMGMATSDGLRCSEPAGAAGGVRCRPHTPQQQGSGDSTQASARAPAQKSTWPAPDAAAQHRSAPVPDQDPAAGALQLSSASASLEQSADPACLLRDATASLSLQSWVNKGDGQFGLASKSVSLAVSSVAGAASPRMSNPTPAAAHDSAIGAEPEQVGSLQQAGKGEAASAATRAHGESTPASHYSNNAPAFWEGRRCSSSSAGHVHGSSAALSALAQAYSRAGQGSSAPAQEAQNGLPASDSSPLEVSELLHAMAAKIDSQASLQDMIPTPCPAFQATTGACSSPSDLVSKGRTTGAVSHNAPQKEPVSEHWASAPHPGLSNPFAAACEQAEQDARSHTQLSQEPSSRPGLGSATLPARDGDTEKSVAALSICCEAGSCIAPPASQCSPFQSAQTASLGRSNAHSSPDSWNGNASLSATARGGPQPMLAGDLGGRGTPLDRSQHSAGRSRLAVRASSQVSARCQPGTHEGAWDSQRSQQQGTCTSAPNSGSVRKSSALEDSAKESICPAELENLEKAWVAMGGGASAAEKLRQQALWQKQMLMPRDSAASGSQAEGPYVSFKNMRHMQQAQSNSRRSDLDASFEHQAGSRVPLSRSGKSGLSVACTPVSDAGNLESGGSACSRLTASNLTELDNLQRQHFRKDKPRSPLYERTHAWLAQTELPIEYEFSAKRAAKLKERCDSYTAKMSNPFETRKAVCEAPKSPERKPNFFKRFIACITIEPW